MSIIWVDDPSFYNSTELFTRWVQFGGAISLQATTGRFGNPCWRYTGGGSAITHTVANTVTGTIACSFFFESISSTTPQMILALADSGTVQVCVGFDNAGHLIVYRGNNSSGTVLATSSNGILANVWYRIELKTTIDPSAGVIELRVNGTSTGWVPNTTGLNTRNTANTFFNQVALFHFQNIVNAQNPVRANDYIFTDNNSPNAGFLGDKRCFLLTPNSDSSVTWTPTFAAFIGTHAYAVGEQLKDSNNNIQRCTIAGTSGGSAPSWATTGGVTTVSGGATFVVVGTGSNPGAHNWMAVSETPSDGDSSYNADSTPNDVDLFGITALPGSAANIVAVNNILYARKDDAGTRTVDSAIKSVATQVLSPDFGLSTSFQYIDFVQETDPNTSAAWTASGVNAALVGYKEVV